MTIKTILKMGDPRLYQVAKPVTAFNTHTLDELVKDMFETMESVNGAGLAAPQIGVDARIVIFGVKHNPRYPEAESVPMTVLINPDIKILHETMTPGWEGCLSVPGMRGLVERPNHIQYSGFDQQGNQFERTVTDFHARVVQHEVDHLDGILYPMRVADLRFFGFEDAFTD